MIENKLLVGSLVGIALYWLIGLTTPLPYVNVAASFCLLFGGAFTLYRYSRAAYEVVILDREWEDAIANKGRIGVYGIWLLALGSTYVGFSSLAFQWYGEPKSWIGSPGLGFGRYIMAAGFALMFYSPYAYSGSVKKPGPYLLATAFVIAIIAAYFLGSKASEQPTDASLVFSSMHGPNRPSCSPSQPVWATEAKTFHALDSRFRGQVIPSKCFETEEDAVKAGYRKIR